MGDYSIVIYHASCQPKFLSAKIRIATSSLCDVFFSFRGEARRYDNLKIVLAMMKAIRTPLSEGRLRRPRRNIALNYKERKSEGSDAIKNALTAETTLVVMVNGQSPKVVNFLPCRVSSSPCRVHIHHFVSPPFITMRRLCVRRHLGSAPVRCGFFTSSTPLPAKE